MLNFIQNIEYYMMFEVIERYWQTFITKMQKVSLLKEMLNHNVQIKYHMQMMGN